MRNSVGMDSALVPTRVGIGHGQMEGAGAWRAYAAFYEWWIDVLVATTIIESGLDVPNANTIFTHNANNFDSLICIRCAVAGRSKKKAFCYFTPPLSYDWLMMRGKDFGFGTV
jgi:transcription-repair coupling factor (superfamily II helicase)